MFSGHLSAATGARNLIGALEMLKSQEWDPLSCFHFVIVGSGSLAREIEEAIAGPLSRDAEYRGAVSDREYRELLLASHIGLCLKMPDHSIGQTTFPSKVIEFATFGLLVVSHRVSDVPLLFSDQTAYLLDEPTAESLGQALMQIAKQREDAKSRAERGRVAITERLNPHSVASELGFLWRALPPGGCVPGNEHARTRGAE